ncbi:MAG TPA: class I SAM-dependent methyltransferase [Acidimicrobiales bacterium]|nr:class I SAM-dependent methyltransferase [Acidimicrobiales bacterium]
MTAPTDPLPGQLPSYAFGDTAVASRRLDVLARVFGPTSRALLRDLPEASRRVVLDLGCGPGHTTAMLASNFGDAEIIGLDASAAFVEEAKATATARCRYHRADVTRTPLPGAPADVIYSRFLLVHLSDPHAALALWSGQLRPPVLVVEEPESIETDDEDFARYLELAAIVVGARGGDLYAGRILVDAAPPFTEVVRYRRTPLDVPAGLAATVFSLNLATWADDSTVAAVSDRPERSRLAERLARRGTDPATGAIRWWMGQLVLGH